MNKPSVKRKTLTSDLAKKARILQLAGDEARIRILCTLFEHRAVCVSDIAESLKMSVASVSHHLQLLHRSGILSSRRDGKHICYTFNKNPLINHIKQFICYKER